jgi:hypothetical protein
MQEYPSNLLFIWSIIVIVFLALVICFGGSTSKIKSYFSTKDGKGVLVGIVLFVGIAILFGLGGCTSTKHGEFFSYSEVYVGLDNTFDTSPQCASDNISDSLTSNGGFRQNIFESADSKWHLNAKYTHHSCVFDNDQHSYDAIGVETSYRFWDR